MDTLKHRLEHIASAALRIKTSAHSALCKAGRDPSPQPTDLLTVHLPQLSLPPPQSIAAILLDHGCPANTARSLSDAFIRSSHQIRSMYQSKYRQACADLAEDHAGDPSHLTSRFKKLCSFMEAQYGQRISAAQQLVVDQVTKSQSTPQQRGSKVVFNQEFVPLLEKYFEYNAYPSAPDRAALARKSMMTPRQIEVWFQNHRNRAKKEGKRLKKLTMDPLPLKLSLESLEKKMPFFIIPEAERIDPTRVALQLESPEDSDDEFEVSRRSTPSRDACMFSTAAPPHAFPTTYPPACDYDPFPVKTGKFTFPAPVWMRKPATASLRPPKFTLDFEDFIFDFSMKLVIREPASRKQKRKTATGGPVPWFAATCTVAPSAPHPALVRKTHPAGAPPTLIAPLPTVTAPSSRLHPFRSPSPSSPPATLVSIAQSLPQPTPVRRKVARLPKRVPQHTSLSHRGVSPTVSDTSPSPSPSRSFSSRTSSFSSDTSERRPSSSSSSSSSSSIPTTPVLSATSLPENTLSPPVSVSGQDFPHDDDLFGDSLDGYSHLNRLRGGHDKQSFNFDALAPQSAHPHHVS